MSEVSICNSGLFIGVDKYPRLRASLQLRTACRDATLLRSLHQSADPRGRYTDLVENSLRRPTRIEILESIKKFARSQKPRSTGIIYYAGHAVPRPSGLILTCSDFNVAWPEDTGVPLARVLSILKRDAIRGGQRFVVFLDCCRNRRGKSVSDDVPSNVTIIYAVSANHPSVENDKGGQLCQAIIASAASLRDSVDDVANSPHMVTLQHYFDSLLVCYVRDVDISSAPPEMVGNHGRFVLLPLLLQNGTKQDREKLPVAQLMGVTGTAVELTNLSTRVAVILRLWNALPVTGSDAYSSGGTVESDYDALTLRVHLSRRVGDDALMEYILHECRYDFTFLSITWFCRMPVSRVLAIKRLFKEVVITSNPDGTKEMLWLNHSILGEYRGAILLGAVNSDQASVRVRCLTIDGEPAPLFYLLPSLSDIFQRLLALSGD